MTRYAVITGAGQGMGQAVALKLARGGYNLVLAGRTPEKLDQTAERVASVGGHVTRVPGDFTQADDLNRLLETVRELTPVVDVLVHSAGEAYIAKLDATPDADFDRIMAINLRVPYQLTREMLPLLRESENASIVAMVSKVALKGYGAGVTAYAAAKTGLLGFMRTLAAELAPQEIRVVSVCPGPVDTPMRWDATPDFERKLVISAESVAKLVGTVVSLPRGTTTGDLLIESTHYD